MASLRVVYGFWGLWFKGLALRVMCFMAGTAWTLPFPSSMALGLKSIGPCHCSVGIAIKEHSRHAAVSETDFCTQLLC